MSRWSARSRKYQQMRAAFLRTHTTCWLCRQPIDVDLAYPHPMSGSVDHHIPASTGHDVLDVGNWRAAHLRCNQSRGNRKPKGMDAPPLRPERAW